MFISLIYNNKNNKIRYCHQFYRFVDNNKILVRRIRKTKCPGHEKYINLKTIVRRTNRQLRFIKFYYDLLSYDRPVFYILLFITLLFISSIKIYCINYKYHLATGFSAALSISS